MQCQHLRLLARVSLILSMLAGVYPAGADTPTAPGYVPGTPYWVPLIDTCMSGGGARNDCIEALPPQVLADFLAYEQANAEKRRALMRLPRIPVVPAAEDLPGIYHQPTLVPELRGDIAATLATAGCLIPQALGGNSNVVTGQLAAAGQLDVAVICSAGGISRIEIFWGGPASCPPPDDNQPDYALLYKAVEWEYYWALGIANPDSVRHFYNRFPEECPAKDLPPLEHDALVLINAEKAASNRYCHEGRWHRLCGAE